MEKFGFSKIILRGVPGVFIWKVMSSTTCISNKLPDKKNVSDYLQQL